MSQFEAWLTQKLQELKTDEGVFLPYILGILEGDEESEEEKAEGITALLADVLDDEAAIEKTLHEILAAWRDGSESSVETVADEVSKLDITQQMKLITQEKIATSKINKTEKTEEEKKIKEAILSGLNGAEGSDDEGESNTAGLVSNSNADAVQKVGHQTYQPIRRKLFILQESQEMREKQRLASAAKKEKDKQDRINQKSQAEERKKKAQEKSAKGERRSGR